MINPKRFVVPWECGNGIDDLALQGPFTREDAEKLVADLHAKGYRATVVELSFLKHLT